MQASNIFQKKKQGVTQICVANCVTPLEKLRNKQKIKPWKLNVFKAFSRLSDKTWTFAIIGSGQSDCFNEKQLNAYFPKVFAQI